MLHADDEQAAISLAAARALLRAETPEEVVSTLMDVVLELDAMPSPPRAAAEDQLPIDITLGIGEPLVPTGAPEVLGVLAEVLPSIVEDARVAMDRTHRASHLAESANSDVLTGLANRRVAMRTLSRIQRGDLVVVVDLDHFKNVNDSFGHDAGDAVLRSFARSLRVAFRASDVVGRIGGEEFVIILTRTPVEAVAAMFERLAAQWADIRPYPITFSAGVASAREEKPTETLKRADQALYDAKNSGRDQVKIAP